MFRLTCFCVAFLGLVSTSFSQSIQDFSLKDYQAPDIRFKRLLTTFSLTGDGQNDFEDNQNAQQGGLNFHLNYYGFKNTQKHQGTNDVYWNSSGNFNRSESSTTIHRWALEQRVNGSSQNRMFFRGKWFSGLHGDYDVAWRKDYTKLDVSGKVDSRSTSINVSPFITIGRGRIEPVKSARLAVDLLHSLEKKGRLATNPNTELIDSLARIANNIEFKRFFDGRFKRIYQLEALDSAMSALGLVDKKDMIYFAQLNDIWGFSNQYSRGSGFRWEVGLVPAMSLNYIRVNGNSKQINNNEIIGAFGFAALTWQKPLSYAWQMNLDVEIYGGDKIFEGYTEQENLVEVSSLTSSNTVLKIRHTLAWYPTTRTSASLNTFVAFSSSNSNNDLIFRYTNGMLAGVNLDAYYWVAPRLRLFAQVGGTFNNDYVVALPTAPWDQTGQFETGLNGFNLILMDRLAYNLNAGINYAIF